MRTNRLLMIALILGVTTGHAIAQTDTATDDMPPSEPPLSAIDWLSQSVSAAPGTVLHSTAPAENEPGVTIGAMPGDVSVSVLGGDAPDAIGVLSPAQTGLPRNLWGLGRSEEIIAALSRDRGETLPALRRLMVMLLLAEADAPVDAGPEGNLLIARIDTLLAMGAIDQASDLLNLAGDGTAALFRRSFDVALLLGSENRACEKMRAVPELAPTFPARVFCLARAGDWNAAALSLRTGEALGQIDAPDVALLSRFLDPDIADGAAPLPWPDRPTPLIWRMFEAIGEPIPTLSLPLAFSHAEIGPRGGWRAQIEAAERLTRAGVIAPNSLLGLYTERQPAASGGVWDRVDSFQEFDTAMQAANSTAVAQSLPRVWGELSAVELEVAFARLYGKDLIRLDLPGDMGALAFRIALLSDHAETAALARVPVDATERFLVGLARGNLAGIPAPDQLGRAIAPAFLNPTPAPDAMALISQGRIGEALLMAIDQIDSGARGNLEDVTEGLSLLRGLGLENAARQAALQLMLLERRG